jgi:glycosyltransferase involved in cell wall biosynthesis
VLRSDPMTKALIARSAAIFVTNSTFVDRPLLRERHPIFTPPPVDHRQFTLEGADVRETYGIDRGVPLFVAIGKVSRHRGFEEVLQTFVDIRRELPNARLMLIGHGEHRPALEALAQELGVEPLWAGYHEDDLAEHYRAADVLLFTARGSDEGHRAILEAMACGTPAATFPIDGVDALVERESIAATADAEALARVAIAQLGADRQRVARQSQRFGYTPAAERLLAVYERITASAERP